MLFEITVGVEAGANFLLLLPMLMSGIHGCLPDTQLLTQVMNGTAILPPHNRILLVLGTLQSMYTTEQDAMMACRGSYELTDNAKERERERERETTWIRRERFAYLHREEEGSGY